MNVLDTSSYGDRPCAKYGMPISKLTEVQVGHEDMTKAFKFDLEVNGQHQIGIMNIRDTLPYGGTIICQIWKLISIQKSNGPFQKSLTMTLFIRKIRLHA